MSVVVALLVIVPAGSAAPSTPNAPHSPELRTTAGAWDPPLVSPAPTEIGRPSIGGMQGGPLFAGTVRTNATWEMVSGNLTPTDRVLSSVGYDPSQNRTILFGGGPDCYPCANFNDTWAYSRGIWTQLHPSRSPPPQAGASLAWDDALQALLFLGLNLSYGQCLAIGGSCHSETWMFKDGNWTELFPVHSPPPLSCSNLVYDPADRAALTFGGCEPLHNWPTNETWLYQNSDWVQVGGKSPPPSAPTASVYDEKIGAVLNFGGRATNDTWEFVNESWVQVHPTRSPPARSIEAMAYDTAMAGTVLFGGYWSGYHNDTWIFRGGNWTQLHPQHSPANLTGSGYVYDASDQAVLIVGGEDQSTFRTVPVAWAWEAPLVALNVSTRSVDLAQSFTATGSGFSPVGGLAFDWNGSSGSLNCSPPTANGSVVACLPTQSGLWNLTLNVTDRDGAWTNATWPCTVYSDPVVSAVTGSAGSGEVGGNVTFTALAIGGTGTYLRMNWSGLPSVNCTFPGVLSANCPLPATGSYSIRAQVEDSNGASSPLSAPFNLTVGPGPSADPPTASRSSAEVGQPVQLFANATGGSGRYLSYRWFGLAWASGCGGLTGPTLNCTAKASGTFRVSYEVTDSAGATSSMSPPLGLMIYPSIQAGAVSADPGRIDLGQSVVFGVSVSGGNPPYGMNWSGLPPGCAGADLGTLRCTPTATGSFAVGLTVSDIQGASASAVGTALVVSSAMAIQEFVASPTAVSAGGNVTLGVVVVGGTAPWSYRYGGLPPGCLPGNASTLSCASVPAGDYNVTVNVTDGAGAWVRAAVAFVSQGASAGSASPTSEAGVWVGIGLVLAAVAVGLVLMGRRRKRGRAGSVP
jgi:hypothetical protein